MTFVKDLLPLPTGFCFGDRTISNNLKRRCRQAALGWHINEDSLNSLDVSRAGRHLPSVGDRQTTHPPSALQRDVRRRLGRVVRRYGPPPASAVRSAALQKLLRSHDVYDLDREESHRPYDFDKVNVCREGVTPKPLRDVVGLEAKNVLDNLRAYVLKTDGEIGKTPLEEFVKPFYDPALRQPSEMRRLLYRLHDINFWTFRTKASAKVGVFTVAKKDGMLRLVFDCRPANALCRKAPYSSLSTSGAFANLDLSDDFLFEEGHERTEDGSLCADGVPLEVSFSAADLADGIYQFGLEDMASYFCLDMCVNASEFGVTAVLDEQTRTMIEVDEETWLWPAVKVLPMAWAWSLWFCHESLVDAMVEAELSKTGRTMEEIRETQVLRDREPPPKLRSGRPILAPYVDDGNLIAWSVSEARDCYEQLLGVLHRRHFATKDLVNGERELTVIGLHFDARARIIRNKSSRAWALYDGLHQLARKCHGACCLSYATFGLKPEPSGSTSSRCVQWFGGSLRWRPVLFLLASMTRPVAI
jgi:hypothetical protein